MGKLFEGGDERFIYRQERHSAAAGYTIARGDPEVRLHRYTIGYDYTKDDFSEADDDDFEDIGIDPDSVSRDPVLLAEDRTFSGPFASFQQIHPDYLSINFVDRFERVEDFNLGNELNLRAHIAPDSLGISARHAAD